MYHVTSRGNRRQKTYLDDADYARFLEFLGAVVAQYGWILHAYCLMPNHYHLLVETPQPNLSDGMQLLNGAYAQWFNRRHVYDGHLFQGRFAAKSIASEAHLAEAARYIVLNPVRAGLSDRPRDWRWSSYRATVDTVPRARPVRTDRLLTWFGGDAATARVAYVEFVHEPLQRPP